MPPPSFQKVSRWNEAINLVKNKTFFDSDDFDVHFHTIQMSRSGLKKNAVREKSTKLWAEIQIICLKSASLDFLSEFFEKIFFLGGCERNYRPPVAYNSKVDFLGLRFDVKFETGLQIDQKQVISPTSPCCRFPSKMELVSCIFKSKIVVLQKGFTDTTKPNKLGGFLTRVWRSNLPPHKSVD